MLRVPGRRARRARARGRRAAPLGDLPRQAAGRHRGPQGHPRQRHPAAAQRARTCTSSAVDVSSNAILRRVGLAKVGDRLAKSRQHPKPHLIDWKDVDIEQTRRGRGAPRRAADQARAAAPRRHRRARPRALAGGARRRVRRPRGRPRRRHLRGAAPLVPGVAAARPARREGQRDPQRDVARRRRRPARRPARRPPPALHRA